MRPGRAVELVAAELSEAKGERRAIARATAWRLRHQEGGARDRPRRAAARPRAGSASPFFPTGQDVGYHTAMDYAFVSGGFLEPGPAVVWMRMRQPLVDGEPPSPLVRVLVAADSGNGVSAALDYRRFLFINTDLTVQLVREPAGEWVCLDAVTRIGADGVGLAESVLADASRAARARHADAARPPPLRVGPRSELLGAPRGDGAAERIRRAVQRAGRQLAHAPRVRQGAQRRPAEVGGAERGRVQREVGPRLGRLASAAGQPEPAGVPRAERVGQLEDDVRIARVRARAPARPATSTSRTHSASLTVRRSARGSASISQSGSSSGARFHVIVLVRSWSSRNAHSAARAAGVAAASSRTTSSPAGPSSSSRGRTA